MLPELMLVTCEACSGDGYTLLLSEAASDGFPAETVVPCAICGGSGEAEVCEGCLEVPEVVGGLEGCRCVAVVLRRAA